MVEALACNDARLIQRSTTHRMGPMHARRSEWDNTVQACPIGCAVWLSRGPMSVDEVERLWEARRQEAEQRAARTGSYAYLLLEFIDTRPWDEVRAGLLGECQRELARRQGDPDELGELERALPVVRIAE